MSYIVAGRSIPKYAISLGTYASVGVIAYLATSGKKAEGGAAHNAAPTFQSSSKDEEDFIKNFVAEAEKAESAGSKH